eukprot:3699777-Prymnesium_polylepis.2
MMAATFSARPGLLSLPSQNQANASPENHFLFASRPSPLARTSSGQPILSRYSATSSRCSLVILSPQQYFQMTLGRLSMRQCRGSTITSSISSSVHGASNSPCCEGCSKANSVARADVAFFPSTDLSALASRHSFLAARNAARDPKLTLHPGRLQRQGPCDA